MALHCPATLLVAAPPRDAGAATALVDALAGDRVLAVACAPGDVAGEQLAQLLDVPLETEPGLLEGPPSSPVLGEIAPEWRSHFPDIERVHSSFLQPTTVAAVKLDREAERFDMGTRIREVEQGPDGAIYLLEDGLRGAHGRMIKLTPSPGRP